MTQTMNILTGHQLPPSPLPPPSSPLPSQPPSSPLPSPPFEVQNVEGSQL
ncbi:hypothetical protein ACOSQ2_014113 [Xanthoceras sorbifolium]